MVERVLYDHHWHSALQTAQKRNATSGPVLDASGVERVRDEVGNLESAQLRSPVKKEIHRREEQHAEYESWDPGHRDLNPHPEKCVASARSSRRPGRLFREVDRYASMAKCAVAYLPVTPKLFSLKTNYIKSTT